MYYTQVQIDRIIEIGWEEKTPFEAILFQFGLPESEVIQIMRINLKGSSFKRLRKHVNSGVSRKHIKKRNPEINHFKCSRQKAISGNRISKH